MSVTLWKTISALPLLLCGLTTAAGQSNLPPAPQRQTGLPDTLPQRTSGSAAGTPVIPAADAVPVQGPAVPLTLQEAISMAEGNSPRLRGATASTARTASNQRIATAYTNPIVEVYAGRQYARPIPTPGVPGLLQHYAGFQTIEIPRERAARKRAAELATTSSRFGEQGVKRSVVADAKHAFYEALRRREEINHQLENLQLVEDLRRRVEVEVNVGEKGRLELTRAEAETARARFAVRSSQLEYAMAIAQLRNAIAASADVNLDPQGDTEPRVALPPLPELRDLVLRTHPAIAQSQTDVQTNEAVLKTEQALRIPRPTVFAEFENQPDLRYWRSGVNIPLPFFDRRRGQIEGAKAAITQSNAVLSERRLELTSALERSYEQYQLADQQVTSLESGELRAAERAVEGAKAAYRFGERGIVEVLDAQRVLQGIRGDLTDARFARQSALVDLQELGAVAPAVRP